MSERLRIVVLGGGTAGWMAANLFAARWPDRATITVIESPEIGIIGVGEGSTPQLKAFFEQLGVAEREWMPRCNATYKNGISFAGWTARPGFVRYFHPFSSPVDQHTAASFYAATRARRAGYDAWAHPDRYFLAARLADERKAPVEPDNFPLGPHYGYHFDAYLVGAFLREVATARGVMHLARKVDEVLVADGQVQALRLEGDERVEGDLFVDASGFRALIHHQALGEPFRAFGENLFNDRAVVMPTPADASGTNAATKATALRHGWCWDIPLTNRTGNGYVYSSRYCAPEEAERELRNHLGVGDEVQARHLTMRVGRVERSWAGNCLAVGLSQGFIEPLEATALHIVQATVDGFIEAFERGKFTPAHRDRFNADIAARYDGIRDYIVLHYRVNGRADTPYWRDNAANQNLSDSLKRVMTCWFTGGDLEAEIADQGIGRYYPALSWHCLLAGYGVYPKGDPTRGPARALPEMAGIDRFIARCATNFGDHKQVLDAR